MLTSLEGNTIVANTQAQQRGGNSRSGNGGANSGNGGGGGSLQLQLPPVSPREMTASLPADCTKLPPIRRDLSDLEYSDIFSRDILDELYEELYIRAAGQELDIDSEELY